MGLPTEEEDFSVASNQNDFELHSETLNNEEVISIEDDQNSKIDELNEALFSPEEDSVSKVKTVDENVADAMAPIALVPEEDANEIEIANDDFVPEIDLAESNENNDLLSDEEMVVESDEMNVFNIPEHASTLSEQDKDEKEQLELDDEKIKNDQC